MTGVVGASLLPVIGQALPLSLEVDIRDGRILAAGPLFDRIAPGAVDRHLGEVLDFIRPSIPADPALLLAQAGRRLTVCLRDGDPGGEEGEWSRLRASVLPIDQARALVFMSFGTDVAGAVAHHGLSASDFSPVDPTVELLFLLEARDAVMQEFRRLSARLAEARDDAEHKAETDALTGLLNRRALDRQVALMIGRRGAVFSVMHVDLDHFKQINDTLGHAAGDAVLEEVGRILLRETRRGDVVTRAGGDEFVLVMPDCVDAEILTGIGRRIIAALEKPISYGGTECRISASIGIALSTSYPPADRHRMLEDADAALYRAKNLGRAQVVMAFPPDGCEDGAMP